MSACWPLRMPPTPKAVLVSLADNANDQGECWPSIPTICLRTCFSERAVQAAIVWLESAKIVRADRSNGRHTRYVIDVDAFQPPQQVHPRSRCTPAAKSKTPAAPAPVEAKPPQQVPSNHIKAKATKSNLTPAALDLSSWPSQPSPQVLADWLQLRKTKRAPVTPTVIATMARELKAAVGFGYTVDSALSEALLRNWQGFTASWLSGAPKDRPAASGATAQGGGRRYLG